MIVLWAHAYKMSSEQPLYGWIPCLHFIALKDETTHTMWCQLQHCVYLNMAGSHVVDCKGQSAVIKSWEKKGANMECQTFIIAVMYMIISDAYDPLSMLYNCYLRIFVVVVVKVCRCGL